MVFILPSLRQLALRTESSTSSRLLFKISSVFLSSFFTSTSYLAKVIKDDCIGCGTCVEKCPMETIELVDAIAVINEEKCIGCGVCAHHCPEEAIKLERTGSREVFLPPVKIS